MNESCFGLRIQWKGIQKKRLIKASKRWKLYALRSLANKRRHKYNWGCVLSNYKLGFHGTSWLNKQNPHSLFNPFLPSVHFFGHKYTKTLNGLFRTTEILLYTLLINFLLLLKTIYIYIYIYATQYVKSKFPSYVTYILNFSTTYIIFLFRNSMILTGLVFSVFFNLKKNLPFTKEFRSKG